MNANQEHSSKTGSGNFNTNILQSTTENFKNHDVNEEQDRYMDRGNQFYRSISYHEFGHLPLAAMNGPILRKTTINTALEATEVICVSSISRLIDTENNLSIKFQSTSRRHLLQQMKTWKGTKWKVLPNYKEQQLFPTSLDENGGHYQDVVTENSPDHGNQMMTPLWRYKPSRINRSHKAAARANEPVVRANEPAACASEQAVSANEPTASANKPTASANKPAACANKPAASSMSQQLVPTSQQEVKSVNSET